MPDTPDVSPIPPQRRPDHDALPPAAGEADDAVAAPVPERGVAAVSPAPAGDDPEPGAAPAVPVAAAAEDAATASVPAPPGPAGEDLPAGSSAPGTEEPAQVVPGQRDPLHDTTPETAAPETAAPETAAPETAGPPAAAWPDEPDGAGMVVGRRRWRVRIAVAVVAALGVLLLGVLIFKPEAAPQGAAAAATSAAPAPAASAAASTAATPYDRAVAALDAQAAALVSGDEAGWLAAVDTGKATLIARYRTTFRNLRGLGITRFSYFAGLGKPVKGDATAMSMRVDSNYCFSDDMCPANPGTDWAKPPHISQTLTLRPVGGHYVISALAASSDPDFHQPTPWENTELVFARGTRTILAAAKGQEKYLKTVLPVAERAAAVADRYAKLNGTPQRNYRIFLAGEKQWKSWYGGEPDDWAIGLAMPLNRRGIDVMLRMSEMDDAVTLRTTVQHELGHVVTLTGSYQMDAEEDTWLSEGIAEYIGWQPKTAAQSFRLSSVRWQFDRAAPKSIVPAQPGPRAPARAGDAFYGLSHWAATCMSAKYGEAKLFTFVRLVLSEDNSYDQASRDAYGVPFKTVDKACVSWIRKQAT